MTPARAELPSLAVLVGLVVVVGTLVTTLAVLRRSGRSKRTSPPGASSNWKDWSRLRRPGGTAASLPWRSLHATGFVGRTALADRRDRHGFASPHHLRQEASVAAARRRAPYTRPSLALRTKRAEAPEVGYPLGRTYRGLEGACGCGRAGRPHCAS